MQQACFTMVFRGSALRGRLGLRVIPSVLIVFFLTNVFFASPKLKCVYYGGTSCFNEKVSQNKSYRLDQHLHHDSPKELDLLEYIEPNTTTDTTSILEQQVKNDSVNESDAASNATTDILEQKLKDDLVKELELESNTTSEILEQQEENDSLKELELVFPRLRFDWTNLEVLSDLAKDMSHNQTSCSLPLATFRHRGQVGLGSDLHVWSQAFCHAVEYGYRIRTPLPWTWYDEVGCATDVVYESEKRKASSLACYFPHAELTCPHDVDLATQEDQSGGIINYTIETGNIPGNCTMIQEKYGIAQIRAAAMEFLFTKVSPALQEEAERQLQILFGKQGQVPKNLITVHIRWGDKGTEMTLAVIDDYINAVKTIIGERAQSDNVDEAVNILLATEDPAAVQQFKEFAPNDWNIYVDVYYQETQQYHEGVYNHNAMMAALLQGKTGLVTLGSLLVSMEANDFVLTTGSNWSRLMNELRKNIIDPRCQNCTRLIDLSPGEYRR